MALVSRKYVVFIKMPFEIGGLLGQKFLSGQVYLNCEIDVTWCVNNVDIVVIPHCVGGGGLDGDTSLALQLHGVHSRSFTTNNENH